MLSGLDENPEYIHHGRSVKNKQTVSRMQNSNRIQNKQDAEKACNHDNKLRANKTAKGASKGDKSQLRKEQSKKNFEFEYAEERVGQKWPVICSTGEIARNYSEYLRTKHWEKIKTFYFVVNSKSCRLCRSTRF